VAAIVRARPDVTLNTINGDGDASFEALRQAGITRAEIPTVSLPSPNRRSPRWV
jgi:hypothetical protein